MVEKKAHWKVTSCTSDDGWINFCARRTDVRKERKGETHSVTLGWNAQESRFANGKQLDAFLALTQDERRDIMTQMQEILLRGLPPLPGENWPQKSIENA